MFKPNKNKERLSFGFSFLLPSPGSGASSSLGDSGVSSPRRGGRLLSGSQCQSLGSRTMLLSRAAQSPAQSASP